MLDALPKNAIFWVFLSLGLFLALVKILWGFSWCCKKCKKSVQNEVRSEDEKKQCRYYSGLFLFAGLLVLATLATILIFAANKVFIKGVKNFPTQLDNTTTKILALTELNVDDSLVENFKSNILGEVKNVFEGEEFNETIGILGDLGNIQDNFLSVTRNITDSSKELKTKIQTLKSKIPNSSSGILADFESTIDLDFAPKTILNSEFLRNLTKLKENLDNLKVENLDVLNNLDLTTISSEIENIGT